MLIMLALAWVVGRRSLLVVGIVAMVLFAALMWRPARSYSTAALIVVAAYIGARLLLHGATERERVTPPDAGPAADSEEWWW